MRVFFDTSVLVAATLENHSEHKRAFALLESVQNGAHEGIIAAHSVAEMYSTLTRMPAPFRHTSEEALLSIEENVIKHFQLSALKGAQYAALVREAALAGITGGAIYDAVILKSAEAASPGRIYTLNLKHFQLVACPALAHLLASP